MKRHSRIPLVLRIKHAGKIDQKIIREKDKFTIGQRSENDLTLFGQEYPKKYTLISRRNGYYQMLLPSYINGGEIREGNSVLDVRDLVIQDILPREKNSYVLKLSPKKEGYLIFGDARIEFLFDRRKVIRQMIPRFVGFSWFNATIKNLFSDLTFKLIFLALFALNMTILYLFKDYEIKVAKNIDLEKVQQRFAKFILKAPEEIIEVNTKDLGNISDIEQKSESKKGEPEKASIRGKKRKRSGRGNPVAGTGLLGLIGGTGSSSKSSSIVDALVDRGLVADLKNFLNAGTNLKVGGKKTKDAIDPLDQLIGTGGSGGIDDFLASLDNDIEEVSLRKQVRVNLAQPSSKTGDDVAMGFRSEHSVMNVVNARMGRIVWLYEKYLKRQPNLRGKVSIQFTIAANGFVTNAKILESTINHPQLERELLNLIRRLKFEPIPAGSLTFVFPFHFHKIE